MDRMGGRSLGSDGNIDSTDLSNVYYTVSGTLRTTSVQLCKIILLGVLR